MSQKNAETERPDLRPPSSMLWGAAQALGARAMEQQDAYVAESWPGLALLAVADGMGSTRLAREAALAAVAAASDVLRERAPATQEGESSAGDASGGTSAAQTRKLPETLEDERNARWENLLQQAVHAARMAVLSLEAASEQGAAGSDAASLPGATLALAMISEAELHVAALGDTRVYHLRNGEARAVTNDHSGAQLLVVAGLIAPEDAAQHPDRATLYRYLGGDARAGQPDLFHLALQPGDGVLLCSDGLWSVVDAAGWPLLSPERSAQELCHLLVSMAEERGADDNVTALLAWVDHLPAEEEANQQD